MRESYFCLMLQRISNVFSGKKVAGMPNFAVRYEGHGELSVVVVLETGSWPEDMLRGP